jgi:UDP-MurNAc hydroxylase
VQVVTLDPGDALAIAGGGAVVVPWRGERPSSDLAEYSRRRAAEWGEFYAEPDRPITQDELAGYFAKLQRRNRHLMRDFSKRIQLVADGTTWQVSLGELARDYAIESEEPFDPDYVLMMPSRVLRAILDGRVGWEEALLSMRVGLRRDPDVFDSRLMGLLRYGHEPAQTLQMSREMTSTEFIERDGLRVPRYCPHAGEDMTRARVCDGVIECPRHHWRWDARTGECVEGGNLRLDVRPAQEPAVAEAAGAPGGEAACGGAARGGRHGLLRKAGRR